jgi:carboxyl-terminal processing protease
MHLNKLILRFLSIVTVTTFLFSAGTVSAFSDVSSSDKDYDAIHYLDSLDIIDGAMLEPDKEMTKGEFIKLLLTKVDFDPSSVTPAVTFKDVDSSLAPYVEKMRQLGIVVFNKNNPYFRPDAKIGLSEALQYLMKFEGVPVPLVVDKAALKAIISNLGSESFIAPLILKASELKLISISNKRVYPFKNLLKRQFAVMLYNMDKYKDRLTNATSGSNQVQIVIKNATPTSILLEEDKFKILEDVWKRLTKNHYDKTDIDTDELIYGAINGIVERLNDPYTEFHEPTSKGAFTDILNNELEGIGASIMKDDAGKLIIIAPLPGSPAEKNGLLPNDIIEKINGEATITMTLTKAVEMIKGAAGSIVKLSIRRGTQLIDYSIKREKIAVTPVTVKITGDNIAIMQITNFGLGVEETFADKVSQLNLSTLKGVVIDVRNNPGGYLDAAIDIAGQFIPKGQVVTKIKYATGAPRSQVSGGPSTPNKIPVVILTNNGTASAAEILAAALKEQIGAKIIGSKSFGKGTVQEIINYVDSSSLKFTVAHWLTPNGTDINKVGIIPDISVSTSNADFLLGNDPQLNRALLELR